MIPSLWRRAKQSDADAHSDLDIAKCWLEDAQVILKMGVVAVTFK